MALSLLLALLSPTPALAGQTLAGDYLEIHYSDAGTWVSSVDSKGLLVRGSAAGTLVDVTWPDTPWQVLTVEYTGASGDEICTANTGKGAFTVLAEDDLSSGTTLTSYYELLCVDLLVRKFEQWDELDRRLIAWFEVENQSSAPLTDVRVMHALDPDWESPTTSSTKNRGYDLDGDGTLDWVQAVGTTSTLTLGYGTCDAVGDEVGFANEDSDADVVLTTHLSAENNADESMHWRHAVGTMGRGEVRSFGFILAVGTTATVARVEYTTAFGDGVCTACDADADGSASADCGGTDCDDSDPLVYGLPDWYPDADGDGYGDSGGTPLSSCDDPGAGYADNADDCDDADAGDHPGAPEECNGDDEDCDGVIDNGCATWYRDADGDGYGDEGDAVTTTSKPAGYVANPDDCDDADHDVNPGADEVCDNGKDDDCDGSTDEGCGTWYRDADGDGIGDAGDSVESDTQPDGYVGGSGDCDDGDATVYPGADEVCDGKDNDCDGDVDEGVDCPTWYRDSDGDGYGDDTDTQQGFDQPNGYADQGGDCDDGDAAVNPAAEEVCNDVDDDCDGTPDDGLDCTVPEHFRGGLKCDSTGGAGAWVVLAALALARRRRSSC